ncbi:hypothetical protein A2715_03350 [Candidatus Woesebacteria bacterium RIFCSPHIGHO2_01_FULL_39_32]|uniref:Uncharacterized protein n=2 Tax=Candidatus Woeseibacteriota TaxID=1752722 RepID=A0A0G0SUW0_9BACT|nr:MAG: hypothetical protein UT61_C0032G0007 [Candidatus Woesebacteria bacterium GW2011_GWA1_39_8]OGM05166.1 MAG: hypothetical protein A2124_00020 [Candidatus Woesebacteria bacterium GWB1_37_5]OGM24775.1 MAG: hypothetical protein A2715_03350 [Candidatus Woesebacteria bacterium RIFCSPHIGHO2_01_FULL_39_32]OGM37096.1 MAG: hypothetical protein A3F01_05290 [Candidatus Woesebacteria bacterium RIFCSPHIGHO2_12_FULL_38_11]OGM64601.1 MAG: hypothetical protein A2893_06265 [Candidatus Woesebacteria bacteri
MYPGWRNNYLRYKTYFLNVLGRYRERADVRVYLEILLSLTAISIFSVFALRPTLLTIAELIKEIESKKLTLTQMEEKINNLSQAQTLFDRERGKIVLLDTSIPQKIDPVIFARQMEGLSSKHQSQILEVLTGSTPISGEVVIGSSTDSSSSSRDVEALPEGTLTFKYSIQLVSALDQFTALSNFLSDLEQLRLPSKLDSLSLSTTEIDQEKFLLMRIEGRLPYYSKGVE